MVNDASFTRAGFRSRLRGELRAAGNGC
jgi:hypothetical protein